MSFKIVKQSQKKTNIGLYETELELSMPKKYEKMTEKEIDDLNRNFIPTEQGIYMKQREKGMFLRCFDLTKRKIDIEKFANVCKDQFWAAMAKMKEAQKDESGNT